MTEEQALACHTNGQQLQTRRRHVEALAELDRAAEYFDAAEGPDSPDLANVLADRADSSLALCRYDEAERDARRSLGILDAVRDRLDPESRRAMLPRAYALLGKALRELGRYPEAEAPLRSAILEAEAGFGLDDPAVADHLNGYGVLCKYWGKFAEGERAYRRALAILEYAFGKESPQTATLYHNLGGLEHARGNFAKGEPLARTACDIRRRSPGAHDPRFIADLVAWGGLLDGLARYGESVPIYRHALAYYVARLGPDHFEVAATLNNLGMARAAQGAVAEATALLEQCLAVKRKLFPEDHPEVRLTQGNLSYVIEAHRDLPDSALDVPDAPVVGALP